MISGLEPLAGPSITSASSTPHTTYGLLYWLLLRRSHFQNYQLRAVTVSMLEPECASPLSSTSTQLPPRCVPVRAGTHTMCFPPFVLLPAWDVDLKSKFS